jgi:hypothetical protein
MDFLKGVGEVLAEIAGLALVVAAFFLFMWFLNFISKIPGLY